jgi:hypothetical protein
VADAVAAPALEARAALRRGVVRRRVVEAALRVVDGALRVRLAAFRVAPAARVAVRFAVLVARFVVVVARRRVVAARGPVPRAICRACLVSPSIRLRTLFTSARVLARLTCVCSVLIAWRAVLSASFSRRSTCRRRSGGTRLSASFSARRPALTARPTRPDRRDVRFLFAI